MNEYQAYLETFAKRLDLSEILKGDDTFNLSSQDNDFNPPKTIENERQSALCNFTLDKSHKLGIVFENENAFVRRFVNKEGVISELRSLIEHIETLDTVMAGFVDHAKSELSIEGE
ncbi:hypothetical protein CR203_03720 [Salipaludibacillus neizhouensis]|uniref:Uncharacterized protein n=1 Tax=Salipaludibacillus neizhouensis TaxID=885475 RepID=A0A3A9KES3_9BACI|nr:hypothetical protein [Salipaludibacillus neizhouensis]RKL69150.1 hypothetical protein CR203_03720 [Salipaludibacillus neizhouensis]